MKWRSVILLALILLAALSAGVWLLLSMDGPCESEAHLADLCGSQGESK